MEENKVYMVTATSGSWDDYTWFIVGIYSNPAEADEVARKFNASIDEYKSRYTREQMKALEQEIDTYEEDYEYSVEAKKYQDWKYGPGGDINPDSAKVDEMIMNKQLVMI